MVTLAGLRIFRDSLCPHTSGQTSGLGQFSFGANHIGVLCARRDYCFGCRCSFRSEEMSEESRFTLSCCGDPALAVVTHQLGGGLRAPWTHDWFWSRSTWLATEINRERICSLRLVGRVCGQREYISDS